jgi:23S rRNA (cytosine1962-C5)-methyltransferase
MVMLKIKLNRDLRKNILRGHPWVYRESLEKPPKIDESCLCQLLDKKGEFLAWAIYSPQSPLAIRILNCDKKPPNPAYFSEKLMQALNLRIHLNSNQTNCYRLINGEGDLLPGFVCDIYNNVAVMQFDGQDCFNFWDQNFLAQWLLDNLKVQTVYLKPRHSDTSKAMFWGQELDSDIVEVSENGIQFKVNIVNGQKTGFFIDQRDNRNYFKEFSKDKTVLNLFSYTGGFSLAAGAGGAKKVTSIDMAPEAIKLCDDNWQLNNLDPSKHSGLVKDVFLYLKDVKEGFDIVMVDPPSMTHSESTKNTAIKSYIDLFSQALKLVNKNQHLFLSSCSSHITFNDFFDIIDEVMSVNRKTSQILRVSGQGFDHPYPHYCHELRYLKFVHLLIS